MQVGSGNGFAVGADSSHVELMRHAALEVGLAPLGLVLIDFHAHVSVEGRELEGRNAGAELARRLESAKGEADVEHAGNTLAAKVHVGGNLHLAVFVRAHIVEITGLAGETAAVVAEVICLVALECSAGVGELHIAVDFQVRSGSAVEPLDGDGTHAAALRHQPLLVEAQVDIELVGLDGLDLNSLGESLRAHLDLYPPVACRGVGIGSERKVEYVAAVVLDGNGAGDLSVRIEEFRHYGMADGKIAVFGHGDGADVQGIARTPYSPLSEDEGLEAA